MTKKLSNFFMRDDCNKSDDKIWPNWLIGVMTIINRTNYRLALWSSKESQNSNIQALSYSKWLNFFIYPKKYQQQKAHNGQTHLFKIKLIKNIDCDNYNKSDGNFYPW